MPSRGPKAVPKGATSKVPRVDRIGKRYEDWRLRFDSGDSTDHPCIHRKEEAANERALEAQARWRAPGDVGMGAVGWYLQRGECEEIWADRKVKLVGRKRTAGSRLSEEVKERYKVVKQRRREREGYLTQGEILGLKRMFEKDVHGETRGNVVLTRQERVDDILERLRAAQPVVAAPAPVSSVVDVDGWRSFSEEAQRENQGLLGRLQEGDDGEVEDVWRQPGEDAEYLP